MDHKGLLMTDIIIHNQPNDYYDVFSSGSFTRPTTRPLNWLENGCRLGKQQEEDEETGEEDERND